MNNGNMNKHIKVGMLGIGNIGTGTYRALEMNHDRIEETTGLDIEIVKILNRHPEKDRGIDIPASKYTADVRELDDPELFRFVYNGVSSDRKAKTDRMVFDKDKKLSLGAGALLEYVLAAHGVADLTFTTEHNKKPRLACFGFSNIIYYLIDTLNKTGPPAK